MKHFSIKRLPVAVLTTVLITVLISACNSPTSSDGLLQPATNSNQAKSNPPSQTATSPTSPWQNAYKDSHGTIWTDILPDTYANCISEKDNYGKIVTVIDEPNRVACQTSYQTIPSAPGYVNDGVNLETQIIYASDAIDACKAIGGALPDEMDYLGLRNLGDEYLKVPSIQYTSVWTSRWDPNQVGGAVLVSFSSDNDFGYEHEKNTTEDASNKNSVRCIQR